METEKRYIVEVIWHHVGWKQDTDNRWKCTWDQPFDRQIRYTGHGYVTKDIRDAMIYTTVGAAKGAITKQFKNAARSLQEVVDRNDKVGYAQWQFWIESIEIREVTAVETIPHLKVM